MQFFQHSGSHRVAVLVRDGVLPLELGLVHQTFGAAATPEGEPLYEVVTCALEPGQLRTGADFMIVVGAGKAAVAQADTVIIPASHESDESLTAGGLDAPLLATLKTIRLGARIASICTGAFVLAAAGMLDGRRATTHWKSAACFRERFPGVHLDHDVLYVDEGQVLSSAGEASGLDLCLHMIRNDHGASVANEVARKIVVAPHRDGGQAQFVRSPISEPRRTSTGQARFWALEHLDQPITLAVLARRESMSVRTFSRRFQAEVGLSPLVWLAQQRLTRARELLEETDLPIDSVAAAAGFGTGTSLRQHLHAAIGVSPSRYRSTFRGPVEVGDLG